MPSSLLQALPTRQAEIVAQLGERFAAEGEELALVGGIVRDLLLNRPHARELDLTTSAPPERTRELGTAAGAASVFDVGERFGTIGFVFASNDDEAPIEVEITTYRTEHYPDQSRHPAVSLGGHLRQDLARRDFTANAIAVDASTGVAIDPFDGQGDLARGLLRAVGEPSARFREDPLRLLRAARFVAQLGFQIEPVTAAAMTERAHDLERISKERIYAELTKLLVGPYVAHGLDALLDHGLLTVAMPELSALAADAVAPSGPHREKDLWDHTTRVVERAPPRAAVRWAALLHDAAKPRTRSVDATGEVHFIGHEREGAELAKRLMRRLKADKAMASTVARLVELHARPSSYAPDWTDSAVRRLMLEAGDTLSDLLDLAAADVTSAREHKQQAAAARIAGLREHIARLEAERSLAELKSPLDGEMLMAMFARPPGRWIATIKERLRQLVIDGELEPGDVRRAEEIARAMVHDGEVS
jgi:poly(A) polymerase